jgi:hypothetical protein
MTYFTRTELEAGSGGLTGSISVVDGEMAYVCPAGMHGSVSIKAKPLFIADKSDVTDQEGSPIIATPFESTITIPEPFNPGTGKDPAAGVSDHWDAPSDTSSTTATFSGDIAQPGFINHYLKDISNDSDLSGFFLNETIMSKQTDGTHVLQFSDSSEPAIFKSQVSRVHMYYGGTGGGGDAALQVVIDPQTMAAFGSELHFQNNDLVDQGAANSFAGPFTFRYST